MPAVKQRIGQEMKKDQNPLVYLEYRPKKKLKEYLNIKKILKSPLKKQAPLRICMGYVSRPYDKTYRITTCRHLISDKKGNIPSKIEILEGLEVYARFEGINKKFHSLLFEDVDIKVHDDILADLLFIEITRPDNYNFRLLNQASVRCRRRFPGSMIYYFQNYEEEKYFRFFEGEVSRENVYITKIDRNGHFHYVQEKPTIPHRVFHTVNTTKEVLITGASGSPILSRRGEVIGMMCAHHQALGKGIYLSIEKIERLYREIKNYHI